MSLVMISLVLPSLALRAVVPAAMAFAPSDSAGSAPNRIERPHLQEQLALRHQPAWEEFTAGDGAGWEATWDEIERTPERAMGPGIPMDDVSSKAGVEASLRTFFAKNPDLLGVPASQLVLRKAGYSSATDMWYVDFDRVVSGAPIWRAGVTARVRHGELVMFGIETYPSVTSLPKPTVSTEDAEATAQLEGPAAMADHTNVSASLVALPWDRDGGVDVRLCWEVHSHTDEPVGDWVTHVDALTGERLNTYNTVSFFDGTIQGYHDTRTVDGSYTTSAYPLEKFTGADGSTVYADESGNMTLSDATTWTTALSGSYVTIRNLAGSAASMSVTADSQTWSTTEEETQAQIDAYKFIHDVRTWGLAIDATNGMSTTALVTKVNTSSTCNSYYDGAVNLYQAGDGCNNTARIGDVVYHEWGHGFHYYALQAGTYDGDISEGIADTVSTLQTHDSQIGPYFYTTGGAVRDVSVDKVYPDDWDGEVHDDGQIFGSAVWDLWDDLDATYGETRADSGNAWFTASTLLANAIKAGPTIPEAYDEYVLADDDNNDASDGTPHLCEIIDAFGRHGLGPGASGGAVIGIDHTAVGNQAANHPIAFTGSVVNLAPGCTDFTLASATVHYSVDDGATWQLGAATLSGDAFTANLPGFPGDTIVLYYVSAKASDGTEVTLPAGGDIAPYTFYVGGLRQVYCETFDSSDGGYTHALLAGRDQDGADDWMYDQPQGLSGDPTQPYTGRKIWGNDLGGGNFNGAYQSSIENRLSSPSIDVGADTQLILQYRRWLSVEDSYYDQAQIYANDTSVWKNHGTNRNVGDEQTEDAEWMLHTVRLSDVANPLVLGWDLTSDGGLEFGGWNIDDVCVYAYDSTVDTGGDSGADSGVPTTDSGSGDSGSNGGDNSGNPNDTGNGKINVGGGCGCATAPDGGGMALALAGAAIVLGKRRKT